MSKVLITGANGLLGANTVREFCKMGFSVRAFIRPNACVKALNGVLCELYHGSIENFADVYNAMQSCDYVVHAASVTGQWGIRFSEYEKINITGTENIIEACLQHKVQKLIYISTANTIAPGTKENPGTELNSFTLFKINSPYINTKYIAQQKVIESVIEKKLPAVIINPTFMIGAYDSKPSSGMLVLYAFKKRLLFYPPGGKNFVHVNDVSRSIVNACGVNEHGECFLVAGENLSYKEFFVKVNQGTSLKPLLVPIPAFGLKLAGLIGSVVSGLLKRSTKLNYATAYLMCLDNYYDGGKARRFLGIRYTPVSKAVSDALDWFNQHS